MSELTTTESEVDLAPLSEAELRNEINRLTAGERTKLIKIARHYARVGINFEPHDLVQEAICRVLDGRRVWPRDLPAIRFLAGVIKSIASEWKTDFVNKEIEAGDEGAEVRGTLAMIDVKRIIAFFDEDPIAQKLLIGMADGTRGEDLERASGLSPTQYESKRKKIRRRIEKLKT
jgi:hypothetical protein